MSKFVTALFLAMAALSAPAAAQQFQPAIL